ncbi:MAG: PAS domain S-box protein [Gammaproteobacteria bacterium]
MTTRSQDLAQDEDRRSRLLQALQDTALVVSQLGDEDIFLQLATHLAHTLGTSQAMIGELCAPGQIATLAVYYRGEPRANFVYSIRNTPCQDVIGQRFQHIQYGLLEQYPEDDLARRFGFNSYAAYPLFDTQGKALGLIAVLHEQALSDIELLEPIFKIVAVRAAAELARKQTEAARSELETSYLGIFHAIEDAVFVHDFETGAIIDCNDKACETYGYSREEIRQLDIGALSSGESPYTLQHALHFIERAKAGETVRFEWQRKNKDGSLHWDEVVLKRATLANQERVLGFARDISERKQVEQALQTNEKQYRSIFNASVDGLVLWNPQGHIVDANPAFCQLFDYAHHSILEMKPLSFVPPQSHEIYQQFMQAANAGLSFHTQTTVQRRNGSCFEADIHAVSMRYQGKPHWLGIVRDISEQRQAEQERERLGSQLRQAQKMEALGHLTGGIAHDFNNILTSILGYTVLACEHVAKLPEPRLQNYLEQIQNAGIRARDLVQQLLTFSRGQRGERRPLALPTLIQESVKLFGSTFPSTVEFSTAVNQTANLVMFDPIQLEQVLMNLCINARDAIRGHGTINLHVSNRTVKNLVCTSCRQTVNGDFVELTVADNGPGIAADLLERIFEPFVSTKETGKGSGMGLATVHGIVHEHGGHIEVHTAPGQGAAFRVLLPPLGSTDCSPVKAPLAPQENTAGLRFYGHVLLVEDEPSITDFMRDLLSSRGFQVTTARNGRDALALFQADPANYDLVITDQTMPKLTGLALARELQRLRPQLPVILYTGYSESLSEQAVQAAGLQGYLRKPLDIEKLFGAIKQALGRQQ